MTRDTRLIQKTDTRFRIIDGQEGKHLYSLEAGDTINALLFSPNRYWLCAATDKCAPPLNRFSPAMLSHEGGGLQSRAPCPDAGQFPTPPRHCRKRLNAVDARAAPAADARGGLPWRAWDRSTVLARRGSVAQGLTREGGRSIKIWDLESKNIVAELTPEDIPPTGPKAIRVRPRTRTRCAARGAARSGGSPRCAPSPWNRHRPPYAGGAARGRGRDGARVAPAGGVRVAVLVSYFRLTRMFWAHARLVLPSPPCA